MTLLINVLVILVIVGVILWGINEIPMDATIKKVIRVVVIVLVLVWLLRLLLPLLPVTAT